MKSLFKGLLGLALVGSFMVSDARADFPLAMDIDVSTKRGMHNIGAGTDGEAKVESVSLRVKVRRSRGSAEGLELTAEVYVIGRQIHTGYYGIIDVVKEDFSLAKESEFEFTTKDYRLGRTSGNINVGGVYETYLVVISDQDERVLDYRSGRVIRERGVKFIREQGPKTLFDRDGNVVGKVDQDNTAFKKAVPAATRPVAR